MINKKEKGDGWIVEEKLLNRRVEEKRLADGRKETLRGEEGDKVER